MEGGKQKGEKRDGGTRIGDRMEEDMRKVRGS